MVSHDDSADLRGWHASVRWGSLMLLLAMAAVVASPRFPLLAGDQRLAHGLCAFLAVAALGLSVARPALPVARSTRVGVEVPGALGLAAWSAALWLALDVAAGDWAALTAVGLPLAVVALLVWLRHPR